MKKILFALVLLNLILVAAPVVILLPPIAHTPTILTLAYVAKTTAPWVSAISAVFGIWVVARTRWSVLTILMFLVIAGAAILARMNYVEWFFASATSAEMAGIGSFHDIQDSDMVIGVTLSGLSRAYPVRYLAYHHMLNDQLGATALLPTY